MPWEIQKPLFKTVLAQSLALEAKLHEARQHIIYAMIHMWFAVSSVIRMDLIWKCVGESCLKASSVPPTSDTRWMHLFSETRHHADGSLSSNLGGQPDSKHTAQPHSHLGRPEPHPVIGDVVMPSNIFEKTSDIVRVVWLKRLRAVSVNILCVCCQQDDQWQNTR